MSFTLKKGLIYTSLLMICDKRCQAVAIRVGNLDIVVVYIQQNTTGDDLLHFWMIYEGQSMTERLLWEILTPDTVDGQKFKRERQEVAALSQHEGCRSAAPAEPKFSSHSVTSTVGLFVTYECVVDTVNTPEDPWSTVSDYVPTATTVDTSNFQKENVRRITKERRRRDDLAVHACEEIDGRLPNLIERIKKSNDLEAITLVYSEFCDVCVLPFEPSDRDPDARRAREF